MVDCHVPTDPSDVTIPGSASTGNFQSGATIHNTAARNNNNIGKGFYSNSRHAGTSSGLATTSRNRETWEEDQEPAACERCPHCNERILRFAFSNVRIY